MADTTGRVDAAPTTDRREIREAIERMKPIAGTARFPEKRFRNRTRTLHHRRCRSVANAEGHGTRVRF